MTTRNPQATRSATRPPTSASPPSPRPRPPPPPPAGPGHAPPPPRKQQGRRPPPRLRPPPPPPAPATQRGVRHGRLRLALGRDRRRWRRSRDRRLGGRDGAGVPSTDQGRTLRKSARAAAPAAAAFAQISARETPDKP